MADETIENTEVVPAAPGKGRGIGLIPLTSKTAHELSVRRVEARHQMAADGVMQAVNKVVDEIEGTGQGRRTPKEAWEFVVSYCAYRLLKSTDLKGMAHMAKWLGTATGWVEGVKKEPREHVDTSNLGLEGSRFVMQVVNLYKNNRKEGEKELDIIEAELKDAIEGD